MIGDFDDVSRSIGLHCVTFAAWGEFGLKSPSPFRVQPSNCDIRRNSDIAEGFRAASRQVVAGELVAVERADAALFRTRDHIHCDERVALVGARYSDTDGCALNSIVHHGERA